MTDFQLNINGKLQVVNDVEDSTPLLWILRDTLGMVGTKYGCGIALCGACTIHLDGIPVRSCSISVSAVVDKKIRTIEGLASEDGTLHALQQAWVVSDVSQCGYCQAGQLMSATALLDKNPKPSDSDIDDAMQGNYCRCGTYKRIKAAIHIAANSLAERGGES
ncbi:MAG: (2Fe-2S)-binding protein [Pseudomonadales bacterium]|nr:(2Fe-2S)-binding protein [Pseudomonadales bacterium]